MSGFFILTLYKGLPFLSYTLNQLPLAKTYMVAVVALTGKAQQRPMLLPLECHLGEQKLKHLFLCMPECPVPLPGLVLLVKGSDDLFSSEATAPSTGPS